MNASKRWIALAPAVLLLAIVAGCKTGSSRFCCEQTSCSETGCAKTKAGCSVGKAQPPCGSAKHRTSCVKSSPRGLPSLCRGKSCCEDKVACGSTCVPKQASGTSCLCKITPGAVCRCKSPCRCKSTSSCGAVARCTTGCAVQLGKPSYDLPAEETHIDESPFERMDKAAPKKSMKPIEPQIPAPPMPMPRDEINLQNPLPLPAPKEVDTAEEVGNPFLRVSRTQEVREREILAAPPATPPRYSQAWADALGLPATDARQPQNYRR